MKRIALMSCLMFLGGSIFAGTLDFPGYVWARGDQFVDSSKETLGMLSLEQGVTLEKWSHITPYVGLDAYKLSGEVSSNYLRVGVKNTTLIPCVQFGVERREYLPLPGKMNTTVFAIVYKEWK